MKQLKAQLSSVTSARLLYSCRRYQIRLIRLRYYHASDAILPAYETASPPQSASSPGDPSIGQAHVQLPQFRRRLENHQPETQTEFVNYDSTVSQKDIGLAFLSLSPRSHFRLC